MSADELIENLVYAAATSIGDDSRSTLVAMSWASSRLCLRYGVPDWSRALRALDERRIAEMLARMPVQAALAAYGSRATWAQA